MDQRNGEARFLTIARIVRPQGRRGEVAAELTTDFPERFSQVHRVFLDAVGSEPAAYTLERAWLHKGRVILKFSGVDSIADAEKLRGSEVWIPYEERVPLPENSFYWSDLMGCRILQGTAEVGIVTGIEPTSGVALLEVTPPEPGRERILIPLAREICRHIVPEEKCIVIEPPEDLLNLNERGAASSC